MRFYLRSAVDSQRGEINTEQSKLYIQKRFARLAATLEKYGQQTFQSGVYQLPNGSNEHDSVEIKFHISK